jgi:TRAP-type C4-dicarboxylate transport system permease small subunit
MKKFLDKISLWFCGIAAVALLIVMLTMTADAVFRKISGSIPGAYNTSVALLALIMFLPQGYAQIRKSHVSIDLITSHFPLKAQAVMGIIAALLGIFIFGLITWGSIQKAWQSTLIREVWIGVYDYPAWPFRWFVPLGFGMFTIQLVQTAIEEFAKVRGRGVNRSVRAAVDPEFH